MNDLKHAFRSLAQSPGFTALAVVMLALGVGASTACFSFLNAFFLRPPPFERPGELVSLHSTEEKTPTLMRLSHPNFVDYRAQSTAFTDLAMHMFIGVPFTEGDKTANLFGEMVSGSYFDLLGVKPALGRPLAPSDDREGAPPVVVVSHEFWQTRLGATPAALGRTLLFNQVPFTVVGVAPAGFRGVNTIDAPNYWLPAATYREVLGPNRDFFASRRAVTVSVFGRLKPGFTLEQAAAMLKPIREKLAADFPADNGGRSLRLVPITRAMIDPNRRADLLRAGNLLIALSGLILLIACANLANLLLSRAGARQRELALRVALGASRPQVVGQLLRENFLLAALGGGLGIVIAVWLRDLLWALRPPGYPDNFSVALDGGVLTFAVFATITTGLLFGVVPALSAARVDLVSVLKRTPSAGGGLPLFSFRHLLVAAQVALSVVALVVAGLFVRSLNQTNAVTLGWNSSNLALLSANLAGQGYDQPRTLEYFSRAIARLKSVPGVVDVSISSRPFLTGANPQRTIRPQGSEDETLRTRGQFMSYASVQPDFLRFMGVELVAGRDFNVDDNETHPRVVIINEALARRAWPGQDPIGKTIKLFNDEVPLQVVGVTRNLRDVELRADPAPFAFFPVRQVFHGNNVFHVRTAGNPTNLLPTLRQELQSLDPAVNLFTIDYRDVIHRAMWGPRTGATLMSVFGALALLLASLGIYAVMSHAVIQRTREIGIRLAIGAQSHSVVGLVLKRGIIVAGVGLLAGLGVSLGLTRYIRSFLFEVSPTDPIAFAAVAVVLGAVALLACWFPARRATKVDPMVALRAE